MVFTLETAITDRKTAGELARSFANPNSMADVHAKAIEVHGVILDTRRSTISAQPEQLFLPEKIRSLEEQITKCKSMGRNQTALQHDLGQYAINFLNQLGIKTFERIRYG